MTRRTVTLESCARWRQEVGDSEATTVEIADREGWSRHTVGLHVYGRCQHPGEGVEPPERFDWTDRYPSDAEVWRWRETRGWAAWARVARVPAKVMRGYFRRHGWAAESIPTGPGEGPGSKGSRVSEAPCAGCWRENEPVEDLTDGRLCRECEMARRARESAPVDLEAEREAFLKRRVGP